MHQVSRVLRPAVVALVFLAPGLSAQTTSPPKFAFVDTRVILDRAPGASDISAQLAREQSANQAKMQKMQDTLSSLMAAYTKDFSTLSDSQKTRRQKVIEDKRSEYEQRASEMDQAAQQRQQELVQPILAQIREVLDKVRQEEGYTFIFDVGQAGVIVAADKNLDITERIISRLKPVGINVTSKSDSASRTPAGAKPPPAGITPVKKPPTS